MKEISAGKQCERIETVAVAITERSNMLTLQQKSATCGPLKEGADAVVRSKFSALAAAVVEPYLASGTDFQSKEWASTHGLKDLHARMLPGPLVLFLPQEQQTRLVRARPQMMSNIPTRTYSSHVICQVQKDAVASMLSAPKDKEPKRKGAAQVTECICGV